VASVLPAAVDGERRLPAAGAEGVARIPVEEVAAFGVHCGLACFQAEGELEALGFPVRYQVFCLLFQVMPWCDVECEEWRTLIHVLVHQAIASSAIEA